MSHLLSRFHTIKDERNVEITYNYILNLNNHYKDQVCTWMDQLSHFKMVATLNNDRFPVFMLIQFYV